MTTQNFTLTGYQTLDRIYSGNRTLVYRGTRLSDKRPVAIKVLHSEYPSFSELVQFRNQYTIAKNLNLPGIIATYSLEAYQNSYALVMEDFGGVSLKEWTEQGETLPNLSELLQMAIDISNTLDILCRHRIIHKDIKPANILINPQTKQVKLIDFSIASLLPRETQTLINPNVLEGTLGYLSPEQTGRMNRGIDYRTDFYSLGVTFYELLAGQLPFQSNDAMELVHSHIAKQPPSLHEIKPEIPQVLSEIVSKLMAKNAEDRYQSALGLKFDLELCLSQLQQSGKIHSFEIGQRDLCDRFIIPEKLYGRENEVKTLLEAFERIGNGTSEMMLVAGFSGIGKTAVVNEVHKPIVKQRGYFVKGKFDQFNRNIPFSAFVQAFRDLMGQLLSESDLQLQTWKTQILNAVGENGQVIIEVIPELERIIGKQPEVTELSGSSAQNRFNLLFQKFVQVFTSVEHPLVIFLDDLQWSDSASLKLLQLLMNDASHLLILGAYRDNEVSPVHPFMLTVDELVKSGAIVNTINLLSLTELNLNRLVADTLKCELYFAYPLTKLIAQKTKGNPFFATQFIKALYDDKLITFDLEMRHWQCDIAQVKALALTDDVVEFMALQLQKLPIETQEMLKLAACIGAEFDLNTLIIISEKAARRTASALWKALQEGLVIPKTKIYKFFTQSDSEEVFKASANPTYRFLHDRVQQAAYSLIPEEHKHATHWKIGQQLLKNSPESEREKQIFEIVNHLNIGAELICDRGQLDQLATLNLIAGQKAKAATAYIDAVRYLNVSLALLKAEHWQSQYDLMLSVHIEAAEAEYLNTNFQKLDSLSQIVLQQAKTVLDEMKIYELQIQSYQLQSLMLKSIETGLEALEKLGIYLDENISDRPRPDLPKIEDLDRIPEMTDEHQLAALRIMMALYPPIYIAKPEIILPLILAMVQLSIEGGHSGLAAYSYVLYGIILCAEKGRIEDGYYAGQLALKLLDKFNAVKLKAKIYVLFNAHIRLWKEPVQLTLNAYLEGYQSGLETGDIEWASYSCMHYCQNLFLTGKYLGLVEEQQSQYLSAIVKNNHDFALLYAKIWMQFTLNMQGKSNDNLKLIGNDFDESLLIPLWQSNKNYMSLFTLYLAKANLLYLFDDVTVALDYALMAREYIGASIGLITIGVYNFYLSLILLAAYPQAEPSKQQKYLSDIKENQENLSEWFAHAPQNFHHKYLLIEAETFRVLGKNYEAGDFYDRAIVGAKANEYIQEEALANELAAKFYLDWGKEKVASAYMQEAYYCYARWGAKAKTDDLEKRYPELLAPIFQAKQNRSAISETRRQSINKSSVLHQTFQTTQSSSSISEALDFGAILKASQALSSEIELEKLLAALMSVVIKNAGAKKAVLLLLKDGNVAIEAVASLSEDVISISVPLSESEAVPAAVVNYVKRTLKTVVLDNAAAQNDFMADPYFMEEKPKSVLCAPILHQGKLIGLLYLENNLTIGAFTDDRTEVIQLLCAQAAISLENARLYQQSQAYAQELERSLFDLQQAELQLVQSEKMSALGNLVAGVAHEINNPVGFIAGNLTEANAGFNDIISHLKLYQEKFPNPGDEIERDAEDIDLDYALADLPKMLSSMKVGCDRIRGISTSLRTFSRADKDYKVPFKIHEGIDSTILILKHRLKANEHRPAIEVVTDYGNLPKIECFPGQLNQVFMNLLANAIDALEESSQGSSFAEIEANPNCITVRSGLSGDRHIKITIADNGAGMKEAVKQRIFDHLFTTKAVGKGTGLGLAIARQIVVEKHGGTIEVNSCQGKGTEFAIVLPVSEESH